MSEQEQVAHMLAYQRLTLEAAKYGPDLIVWPASSLPAPIAGSRMVRMVIEYLGYQTGSYLLVGGAGYEKMKPRKIRHLPYSNSEFLISPVGHVVKQYNKIRLLPFNEYVPLSNLVKWPGWITNVKESFLAGDSFTLFEVAGARFGTPVCWENMFPDFFRRFVRDGANLMVSVTNDGFFGRTAGPHQTLAANVFRAVENRVGIVRASPTGVSALVSPNGEITDRVLGTGGNDLFVSGYLVGVMPLSNKKTFYTRFGDIFAYACGVTAALFAVIAFIERRQGKGIRQT